MTKILGIVKEGRLIPEELWARFVSSLENNFENLETNKERAKRELAESIIQAIKRRVMPKFGIFFSGGVDSSLIALISKQLKLNFTCYTVGIENADDIQWAQRVASEYGFNLKSKILSLEELEIILKNVIKILNDSDIVKASVGSVLYAAGKSALADNNNILFGGLGSEEIFAGYERHETALQNNNFEALHKECWSGLKSMWKRDLTRDFAIAKNLGLDLRTPFLDKDLIKIAMNVHPMFKLDKENKKIILREVAEFIGLKKEFAWRKKQAAQYGSDFVNGIDKLARKNGFKMKKDYLQSLLAKSQNFTHV
ncbi:asparagine synthase C-terminal domain-containing protein [Candidatus Woesearchaeota archaeon]|nr:asparagine synthase C-terminal domain-containing protein [Candidatus Woesearchaeota archaeon]